MESAEIMLRRLHQAIDVVRLVDATLPIQTFAAFVAVAMQQGQSISTIGEKVGISQSSASRNLSALSDWDYKKKVGLKLVEYRQDPMNLSIKTVHLTAKGPATYSACHGLINWRRKMSIRARGSSFMVDVTKDGRRKRIACGTREEAESVNGKLSSSVTAIMEPEGWALRQAVDQCRGAVWQGKGGERSAVRNSEAALAFFGESVRLDDITTDWVDAWIARLKQIGNSNGTVNRKLAALSKVMSYAHRRGKVKARPHFERQLESEGRLRYLTQEEEVRSLATLSQWGKDDHAEAVCVLVDSGIRPSELWRLEGRDCNFENGTMAIWQTKNKHPRSVPMTQRVREIMVRRNELTLKGQRLFPFDNDWMGHAWERMKHAMGLADDQQFVPYALRHTCASRLVQRGVNLRVVQEWMGHKAIQVTMRYAHLSPTNLLEAVKVLEAC